jgi:hypothetical protein
MSGIDRYLAAYAKPARKPKVNAGPRRKPEADLQKAVVKALRLKFKDWIIHGSLMGVNLGPRKGAEAKAMGCLAGWPDLTCISPDGEVSFIELKSPDKNVTESSLSDEQKAFRAMCEHRGFLYDTANSIDGAVEIMKGRCSWI